MKSRPKHGHPPYRHHEAPAPLFHPADLRAPNAFLVLLEGRAPWEWAAMFAAMPWLKRLPRGDGHPVIVFPGLGATDITTAPLRGFLQDMGYSAYPWKQGFNFGPRRGVLEAVREYVQRIAERHDDKVSLIGWSLGGLYAREMAKEFPAISRCVITLGSPFTGHPRATNAWRFYEMVSGQNVHDPELIEQIRGTPPVPTTSIYSRTDGVVAWQCSLNEESPLSENIEVHASHIGMGMNPLALYAIADRLRQDPAHWKRFDVQGARRWFYKTTGMGPFAAANA
ncbi:MAG: alpha/beta hydrolase [Aquincola sp.]|nr:alpha/beta hydrolase [Aquincola sp.]MDH4289733.1 alpha/beta hydrolase [Aquincola sp.]MDH5330298.1 alpha/beta hydrolase [Aquincola sp.]